MEYLKDYLTNDLISKRFENRFDSVNYAISVAKEMIHAGRGPRVKTDTENPALQVLEEIVAGKEKYEVSDLSIKEESKKSLTVTFGNMPQPSQFEENPGSEKIFTE
jgi:hypothetical protein